MSKQSFSDELWQGLGNAIDDIRQKVVEEPMYGRAVTDGPECPHWPEAQEMEPSFGSSTHIRETEPNMGPEREQQQDIDLDR
jgi:hypothetical protein